MDGQKSTIARIKVRHHHKPYLLRHVSLLVVGSWLIFASLLSLTLGQLPNGPQPDVLSVQTANANTNLKSFSTEHISFFYEAELLGIDSQRDKTYIYPQAPTDAATTSVRLTIVVNDGPANKPDNNTTLLNTTDEQIAGSNFQKKTYQHKTVIGGQTYHAYSIEWTGRANDKALAISLDGLQSPNVIPDAFKAVLGSLSFTPNGRVLGTKQALPANYTTDAVSPAVVKIYRVTCGILVVDGRAVGEERCDASTGSGFFVSSDGLIATSGHVVTREAEDMLVDVLLHSPLSLANFLKYLGLNDQQIGVVGSRPELLAAVIARLYDAPDDVISFKDQRSVLLVSMGSRSLVFESEQDARKLLDFKDTNHVKQAEQLASNYSAKDLFVLASGDQEGFSASDVALIKVDAKNTPYFELFSGQVAQNQKITIIGFPGDADNILTDNNSLTVTATSGSIGAIRAAAGSRYKLYQSDADASQGNSGGPVVDDAGQVLGLLTYRYKNSAASDAAKSYIRDIADLKDLAEEKNLTLAGDGTTQSSWTRGLLLFSENHFSQAIKEFEKVKDNYPAHRLVGSYIRAAEQGIADGQDVKDVPLGMVIFVSFIGAAGAGAAIILIARHHSKHVAYNLGNTNHTFTPHHAST